MYAVAKQTEKGVVTSLGESKTTVQRSILFPKEKMRVSLLVHHIWLFVAACVFFTPSIALSDEELSLFDGTGRASAYIVTDTDLTIYLWTGEPVAYLVRDRENDFHVYGFNGSHLGWFVRGVIRDRNGDAACALRDVISNPQLEPLKSLKSLKALKSLKELAPLRPLFSNSWGELPCRFHLSQGR